MKIDDNIWGKRCQRCYHRVEDCDICSSYLLRCKHRDRGDCYLCQVDLQELRRVGLYPPPNRAALRASQQGDREC